MNKSKVNRNYKDSIFRMLFRDKKNLLSLYNAVNGTSYSDWEALKVVTLENAIYMNMKNDQAFMLGNELNLYEHQSSWNPNMPMRDLFYLVSEYQGLLTGQSLYSSALVKVPTPNFIVFYNGLQEMEERVILKLSDAFEMPTDHPNLELLVTQLNINEGYNEQIKETCQILKEYMQYVERVRSYAEEMELQKAVERTVKECIEEGILKDFLIQNRAEAIMVSIFEYDEEKEKELMRKAEFEVGRQSGIEEGRREQIKTLIQIKLQKGKILQQIADELEEDISVIEQLIQEIEAEHLQK